MNLFLVVFSFKPTPGSIMHNFELHNIGRPKFDYEITFRENDFLWALVLEKADYF